MIIWLRKNRLLISNMALKLGKDEIKEILSKYQKQKATEANLVRAAVLVPLFYWDGKYHLLFTQRSNKVTYHKGQVSFPGGVHTKDDPSLLGTALRESYEEIGLKVEDVEILGELDDTVTLFSGFAISSFVAFIPYPYLFRVNQEEIDELFDIPLSVLSDKNNFRIEYQVVSGRVLPTYFYEYRGRVIWGATARITNQLVGLLFPGCGAPL